MVNRNGVCFPDDFLSGGPCTHPLRPALNHPLVHLTQLLTSDQLSFHWALPAWRGFSSGCWRAGQMAYVHPSPYPVPQSPHPHIATSCTPPLLLCSPRALVGNSAFHALTYRCWCFSSIPHPQFFFFLIVFWELQFSVSRWREWKALWLLQKTPRQVLAA